MVGYDGLLELTGKLNQVTKLVIKRYHEGSNLVSKVQFFTISRRKIIKNSKKSTKESKKISKKTGGKKLKRKSKKIKKKSKKKLKKQQQLKKK